MGPAEAGGGLFSYTCHAVAEEPGGTVVLSPFDSTKQGTHHSDNRSVAHNVTAQWGTPVYLPGASGANQVQECSACVTTSHGCNLQTALSSVDMGSREEIWPAETEGKAAAVPVAMQAARQLRRLYRQLDSFGEADRFLGRFELLGRQHRCRGGVTTADLATCNMHEQKPAF